MEENLEIYFCEICSESIPANDLKTKTALEVKGKVIGPCCLPGVQQQPARGGLSTTGVTALGAVLLAAIAGATIHLEWRLSDEVTKLRSQVAEVESNVASSGSRRYSDLEKSLEKTAQPTDLEPLADALKLLAEKVATTETRLSAKLEGQGIRFTGVEKHLKTVTAGLTAIRTDIQDVENEVLRLERDVAAAAAAPAGHAVERAARAEPTVGEGVAEAPGLPPALAHQVSRLKDADAGNRFEAVDQLVQSSKPEVLEHLIPMLKDADAFVRRLTAEGLSSFQDRTSVDALLVALADPESIVRHTAHESLKKLTSQSIAFDPDGSSSNRGQAQRRWKDWWAKNRDKF